MGLFADFFLGQMLRFAALRSSAQRFVAQASLSTTAQAGGYAQEKTGDLYDAGGKRGSGGRSSVSGVTTAVFGATGFMGRYVVNKLGQIGTQVLVPYRGDEHDWRHLKLMGDLGQIVPVPFDPRSPESIREVLVDADFVVNLMGVDFPTANWSYEATHVHLAGAVAEQAADVGVEKLVHVSHLNANPDSDSEFLASKGRGELEVLKAFEDATIVKPASIVGDEDRFLNPMGGLAKLLKAIPVVNDGNQLLQPITCSDVATGIIAALDRSDTAGNSYYMVGPEPRLLNIPDLPLKYLGQITAKFPNTQFSDDTVARALVDEIIPEGALTMEDLNLA